MFIFTEDVIVAEFSHVAAQKGCLHRDGILLLLFHIVGWIFEVTDSLSDGLFNKDSFCLMREIATYSPCSYAFLLVLFRTSESIFFTHTLVKMQSYGIPLCLSAYIPFLF